MERVFHDDVIKWKHFPRNWPFVREIHRSPVNFPHKGQWRGALMFSLNYAWINDWVNNREAGDLRRQHGHYDVIVMLCLDKCIFQLKLCHRCGDALYSYLYYARLMPIPYADLMKANPNISRWCKHHQLDFSDKTTFSFNTVTLYLQ